MCVCIYIYILYIYIYYNLYYYIYIYIFIYIGNVSYACMVKQIVVALINNFVKIFKEFNLCGLVLNIAVLVLFIVEKVRIACVDIPFKNNSHKR